jgi:hypothetical protein
VGLEGGDMKVVFNLIFLLLYYLACFFLLTVKSGEIDKSKQIII